MTKNTTRAINAFTHCNLSGSRTQLTLEAGTEVKSGFDVDNNDPLYGEAVVWFKAMINGEWTQVGARNLPVLKKGWVNELFVSEVEAVQDEADYTN